METKRIGAQTLRFSRPPRVESFANIGAKLEGQGPMADYFDELSEDSFFGEKTWEKGEARMQKRVLSRALEKATRRPEELDLIFAGDLLNQCIGTSFALREFGVPLCGVYGACSTMGESLALAAMSIDGGFARRAAAMTSSHFCTAERQYRMPVPYGSQRTPTAQWTATAAGCCILSNEGRGPAVTHAAIGRIVTAASRTRTTWAQRWRPRRMTRSARSFPTRRPHPRTTISSSPAISAGSGTRSSRTSLRATAWT